MKPNQKKNHGSSQQDTHLIKRQKHNQNDSSTKPNSRQRVNKWNQKTTFQKAIDQYQKKKEENLQEREERNRKRLERAAALEIYRKQKREKFAKLSKKTKKGQPVMKHRMDLLLERIKRTVGSPPDV